MAEGRLGQATGHAWGAAVAAMVARDAETLEEVRGLAGEIEEQAEGSGRREAQRIVTYCAACIADVHEGVPPDSPNWRIFRWS